MASILGSKHVVVPNFFGVSRELRPADEYKKPRGTDEQTSLDQYNKWSVGLSSFCVLPCNAKAVIRKQRKTLQQNWFLRGLIKLVIWNNCLGCSQAYVFLAIISSEIMGLANMLNAIAFDSISYRV